MPEFLFFLTTTVVRKRIMQWSSFWTWSRREDSLGHLLFISISIYTQKTTVTAHLTALRCCTGSKMSLLLRCSVKFLIPSIMLNLFKCSMKTSLTCGHYWMIFTTDLILKLSTSMMSSSWKSSQYTLVLVKISMVRQSQNIIMRRTMPTAMHKGIK